MTYDEWKLASPPEAATCPQCGGGLEINYEAGQVYCPECEQAAESQE